MVYAGIADSYTGIDYGMGTTNIDRSTGIRYGCISQHSLCPESFHDSMESVYPDPSCPECGGEVIPSDEIKHRDLWETRTKYGCFDYACLRCRQGFSSDSACADEPIGLEYVDEEYELTSCLDSDVMVIRSPFYTYAQFCSPCVPGAGSLDSPMPEGVRTYALGHDWFEGGVAPYPVYRVADNSIVEPVDPSQLSLAL